MCENVLDPGASMLSTKADVYSFGCIILEVLTGIITFNFSTANIFIRDVSVVVMKL